MPREPHPVVQSLASARYLPMVSNPLIPIVDRVGEALSAIHPQRRVDDRKNANFTAARADQREALHGLLLQVLDQLLMAESAASAALRKNLIALLATREVDRPAPTAEPAPVAAPGVDPLLTTAEVADRLEVSRPYVVMLCKWGRLGEVTLTEGGHRRIRSSAVDIYLAERAKEVEGAQGMSPREAGVTAGLYDLPDSAYSDFERGDPPPEPPPSASEAGRPSSGDASKTRAKRPKSVGKKSGRGA